MARSKRKTVKQHSQRRGRKASNSVTATSSSMPPTLDIQSSADVKKALDIMRKHPLTVILVFASWCPHCHTFMNSWNKYKSLPNRTCPMIRVEQQQSEELLNEINGENGEPVSVNAFPTVLASTSSAPSTGKSNVGTTVNTDESSMVELLTNGSNAVSGSNNNSDPSELASSNSNSAANFTESMSSTRKATPFVRTSDLSNTIRQAVSAATARRAASAARKRRLANSPGSNESILPAINVSNNGSNESSERFVKPPKRIEVEAMNGGGCPTGTCGAPSGLVKLSGGGMSQSGSLFEALRTYASGRHTRKNNN